MPPTPRPVLRLLAATAIACYAASGAQAQPTIPPGQDLLTNMQALRVAPLTAPEKRYLLDRKLEHTPADAAQCRDLDRRFNVTHSSYGADSPRSRRILNDCSPTLRPNTLAP